MDKEPLVSIITASYNSSQFIEGTIRSIREQSYRNIEYIIIDGGSNDGTAEIVKKHEKEIDYWVSEPDDGISDAFNKGVLASTGEVIGFMNSQDYYYRNDVIEKVVKVFGDNPDIKIIYGKTFYVPDNSSEIVGIMGERFSEEGMKKRNIIPHQSVFTKREIFDRIGFFSLDLRYAMDYELFLKASKIYTPFFIDEGFSVMRLGGISDTDKFSVSTELFRAQVENGESIPGSFLTLLYHYFTSAGSKFLRIFNIYTLWHLYKKLGFVKEYPQ